MTLASPTVGSRVLTGDKAEETYLTVTPAAGAPPESQARVLYSAVRETLSATGSRIFSERVFATREAIAGILAGRRTALGNLDDGVQPTRVVVSAGLAGRFAGVQVHAVASGSQPVALRCPGSEAGACGRELRIGDDRWLTLSELSPGHDLPPREQARRMFDCAARFLRQAGTDMRAVARTWLWLRDICRWYSDFNAERTAFFKREGLIRSDNGRPRLPASTGIGLATAGDGACALDLIALPGGEQRIVLMEAGGDQESAFAYGSAFSRAAVAPMPGGPTLFVSGTAAIDAQGRTQHVGQIEAQIRDTIGHVRAVLARAGCTDEHVLSALVFCKTMEVEQTFRRGWADLGWPAVTMIGEVCRPDLLFEVEVTAGPVPGKSGKG